MTYRRDVTDSEWVNYLRQGYDDLDSILTRTRPVGQQFYQGNPVWNRHMLKEEDVLDELQNNSIFTTICAYLEDAINCESTQDIDSKVVEFLSWYLSVCERCSIHDVNRMTRLLRETIFYASFRFNGYSEHHQAIITTERNERLLESFQRLSMRELEGLEPEPEPEPEPEAGAVSHLASQLVKDNNLNTIVLITPELGKWSTVGGLGVMVDNLSKALARQGQEVMVISPYYDSNRYGEKE